MNNEKLNNWIVFKRDVLSSYRNREITRHEYFVYLHLRLSCSPYGTTSTSIDSLRNDVFGGQVSINYINKVLLSLKSKKLLWFKPRQGSRGTFEVHFGDFILPSGKISSLGKYFGQDEVTSNNSSPDSPMSEVGDEDIKPSQRFDDVFGHMESAFTEIIGIGQVRSYNNNTHNEKDNENEKLRIYPSDKYVRDSHLKNENQRLLADSHLKTKKL